MINVVVLHGRLSRPAQLLELPSGARLASLDLTVRREDSPAETVPVQWSDPPAWAASLDAGSELAVLGRVRRRYFRAGGATQSRTEVVAVRVVRAGSRAKVRALVDEAVESIDAAASS
jgi:single-strand DNA-binding protein